MAEKEKVVISEDVKQYNFSDLKNTNYKQLAKMWIKKKSQGDSFNAECYKTNKDGKREINPKKCAEWFNKNIEGLTIVMPTKKKKGGISIADELDDFFNSLED